MSQRKLFVFYQTSCILYRIKCTKRECSVQEAVYHVMPELWLRKTCPGVIFANSNLPENRYKMFRSQEEIAKLPDDSTDIFKRNMLDRYMDRPNEIFLKGKYAVLLMNYVMHSFYHVTT